MKRRVIPYLILALFIQSGLNAQVPDSLMKVVLQQNRELRVAREASQVAILEAGTGITPPDPEVEFAYLFGNPGDAGNRMDFGVSQQLDFPTAYIHRSRVKDLKVSRAELAYIMARRQILLEARQLWIEQLYLNQLQALLDGRLRQAETIHEHMEQKVHAGEAGPLEMGQSTLLLASLEAEYDDVHARQEHNSMALLEITGGVGVAITDTIFPSLSPLSADSLLNDYRNGADAQFYLQGLQMREHEKNLAVSEHLPRITAGYYSETVIDQAFRGLRMGISVPLWENSNTVKRAKSEVAKAEAETGWFLFQQEMKVKQQLSQLESTADRVRKLEKALEAVNSISLLSAALESGEISLSEYFYNSDFYFRNQQQLLRYKRDLLVQEAELMQIYL